MIGRFSKERGCRTKPEMRKPGVMIENSALLCLAGAQGP